MDILNPDLEAVLTRTSDGVFIAVRSVLLIVGDPEANLFDPREAGQFLDAGELLTPGDRIACRILDKYWYITVRDADVEAAKLDQTILAADQLTWIDDGQAPVVEQSIPDPAPASSAEPINDEANQATSDLGSIPDGDAGFLKDLGERSASDLDATALEQVGFELLFFQHDLIQESLDLAEQENEMVVDALTMAIDQVQDMRITWLEKPPRTPWSEILIVAALMITIELGVAALATHLIFRAIRISTRIKIKGDLGSTAAKLNESRPLSLNLKELHKAAVMRVNQRRIIAQANHRDTLGRMPMHEWQQKALKWRKSDKLLQKGEKRAQKLEQEYNRLRQEIEKSTDEFARLSGDLKLTDSMQKLGANERFDALVTPYLKNLSSPISSVTGKYAKEVSSRGLKKRGQKDSGLRGQQEPEPEALVPGSDEKDSPEGMDGDTPSTIIRSQVLRWRRTQLLEIARIRRLTSSIYNHAIVRPDTLDLALLGLRDTMAAVVWPEDTRINYARAIRELSKKFEFMIWAQILPNIDIKRREPHDHVLPSDKYQGVVFDFLVDGVNREVAEYLIKRFSKDNEYSERAILRIVGEMNAQHALLEERSQEILKRYSTSKPELKLSDPVSPGTLKDRYRKDAASEQDDAPGEPETDDD